MASLDTQQQPKLLTQVRQVVRSKHYSHRTEESYVGWEWRYVRFHGMRHPAQLGAQDVNRFLSALADSGRLSASSPAACDSEPRGGTGGARAAA